jgi:hypothetical protein
MVDFINTGTPFETPLAAAEEEYAAPPAGLGQALGEEAASTIQQVRRVSEQGAYEGSGFLAQFLYGQAFGEAGAAGVDVPAPGTAPTPIISHDEYQKRYAPNGPDGKPVSLGDGPMPEAVAQLVGEAKRDELERDAVLSRFQNSHGLVANLGEGAIGFMLDPLRAATAFVPGLGEEAVAARLGGGLLARVAGRVAAGAAGGAAAQAPVAALEWGLGQDEASDYGIRDALRDVAFGAAGNAIVHAGFGALGELWRERTPSPAPTPAAAIAGAPAPTPAAAIAGAGAPASEAAAIAGAPATVQHEAISAAVAQIADGRPVETRPLVANTPYFLVAREAAQQAEAGLRRPPDIIDFLNERGGLADEGGELAAMDLDKPIPTERRPNENAAAYQQRRSRVLAQPEGMPLDEAREIAEEDGYLQPGSTINDLLDAVRETAAGRPVFKQDDALAWQEAQQTAEAWRQEAAFWDPNKVFGPDAAAEAQAQLYREGYAAGIPEREFVAPAEELELYHGTPHTFEPKEEAPLGRFDQDKIGTGEGAQSYGYGIYLAQSPDVASEYRSRLTDRAFINKVRDTYDQFDHPEEAEKSLSESPRVTDAEREVLAALKKDDWLGFDYPHQAVQAVLREPENFELSPQTKAALDHLGSLYETRVRVPAHALLDWDKPLSEQPEILEKLHNAGIATGDETRSGADWYDGILHYDTSADPTTGKPDAAGLSKRLSAAGIRGIRYLDQNSRTPAHMASIDAAQLRGNVEAAENAIRAIQEDIERNRSNPQLLPAYFEREEAQIAEREERIAQWQERLSDIENGKNLTRNFVIFNPEDIQITGRNGERLAPPAATEIAPETRAETQQPSAARGSSQPVGASLKGGSPIKGEGEGAAVEPKIDPELAEAERQLAASGAVLTPEEAATADGLHEADRRVEAIGEATDCLREAGL